MKLTFREYFSGLMNYPFQSVRAFRLYGFKGLYLSAVLFLLRKAPFGIKFPPFGYIALYNEFLSIHDNFTEGEIRNPEIENSLQKAVSPVVVDLGINLGMTVRWWLHLNAKSQVYGIDMIPESLDFTTKRLNTVSGKYSWTGIPSAISDKKENFEIRYDDPLEGTNSVAGATGNISRKVEADTLDNILSAYNLGAVHLIKIDIEGFGAIALRGAEKLLNKSKYLILETHNDLEISEANKILVTSGWELFTVKGRSAFYRNPSQIKN